MSSEGPDTGPPTRPGMELRAAAATDVGRQRQQNEDNVFAGSTVFAVADGMGGHQAGEVASDLALEPLRALDGRAFASGPDAEQALVDAIVEANRAVIDKANADPDLRGMGTTLTAALVRDGKAHVAHVGDSRAYLLRDGEGLTQLTTDHTLVEQLLQEGRLTPEEAASHPQRSVITRAIGVEDAINVDALPPLELRDGDVLMLCSDGLSGPVDDAQIAQLVANSADGDSAVNALIDAANEAGGPDNITVVLLAVEGGEAAPAAPDDATQNLTDTEPGSRVAIRTREESGSDWASSMSRYGAPQGADPRSTGRTTESSGKGRRILAAVVAIVVLAAVLVGGGAFVLSRAWFVGADDTTVALYQGVPDEAFGVPLHRVVDTSDVPLNDLSPIRQRALEDGISVGSAAEGRELIEEYREEAEAAGEPDDAPDEADEEPDEEPDDS